MDEVQAKLKEAFEIALTNGVLLRSVTFQFLDLSVRGECDRKSIALSGIDADWSLVMSNQPV